MSDRSVSHIISQYAAHTYQKLFQINSGDETTIREKLMRWLPRHNIQFLPYSQLGTPYNLHLSDPLSYLSGWTLSQINVFSILHKNLVDTCSALLLHDRF